ncbi:MAG: hypothetical protein QXT91_00625 [Candidatus Caldarchaeum sp.]
MVETDVEIAVPWSSSDHFSGIRLWKALVSVWAEGDDCLAIPLQEALVEGNIDLRAPETAALDAGPMGPGDICPIEGPNTSVKDVEAVWPNQIEGQGSIGLEEGEEPHRLLNREGDCRDDLRPRRPVKVIQVPLGINDGKPTTKVGKESTSHLVCLPGQERAGAQEREPSPCHIKAVLPDKEISDICREVLEEEPLKVQVIDKESSPRGDDEEVEEADSSMKGGFSDRGSRKGGIINGSQARAKPDRAEPASLKGGVPESALVLRPTAVKDAMSTSEPLKDPRRGDEL